jgi:hypothetical protein
LNEKGENMSKLRSDSTWAPLTSEQRETLETWLFEENLGYDEALARAQKEFGITGTKMSLMRFYQRLAEERMREEFLDLKETIGEINGTKANWETMGDAAMALIAKRMVQLAVSSPHKVKELATLARVLVSNEAQNIRRGWLEMGREKFEFDAATACLLHKIEIDAIAEEQSLDDGQRLLRIRQQLFGPNLPD